MGNRIDIEINNIQIITKKREANLFTYTCREREADGFVYFIGGHGTFTDANRRVYPITDASVVLLKRGDSYSFTVDAGCEYITSAYTVCADASSALALLPRTFIADEFTVISLEAIHREWQMLRSDSYMKCKLKLLSWYMYLISVMHVQADGGDYVLSKAKDFIHANFKRNFSGEELAAYCSQSLSHLRVKFKRAFGMSILAYRDKLRITLAREMLQSRLFSVKEIAYELGYADVYHFTKSFTAAVGIPPARFARELTK